LVHPGRPPSPDSSVWAVSFAVVLLVPLIAAVSGFVYFKVRRRNFKRRRRNFINIIIPEPSKESPKEHGMVKRVEGWFIPFYNYKGIIATI